MPFSSIQRIHFFHFKIDTKGDLRHWYLLRMLRDVTSKLVGFFIPIWLFQIGSNLVLPQLSFLTSFQNGLLTICAYYFLFRLVIWCITLPVVRLFEKYGYHTILFMAQVGQALVLLLMSQSGVQPQLLLLAAVIDAIQFVSFWSADSHLLANQTLKSRVGEDFRFNPIQLRVSSLIGAGFRWIDYCHLVLALMAACQRPGARRRVARAPLLPHQA